MPPSHCRECPYWLYNDTRKKLLQYQRFWMDETCPSSAGGKNILSKYFTQEYFMVVCFVEKRKLNFQIKLRNTSNLKFVV